MSIAKATTQKIECNQQHQQLVQMSLKQYNKATADDALKILNILWYTVAQKTVEKIIESCDLDPEREEALRTAALRPMDFSVVVESDVIPTFEDN
jgi:hypothetical protein